MDIQRVRSDYKKIIFEKDFNASTLVASKINKNIWGELMLRPVTLDY